MAAVLEPGDITAAIHQAIILGLRQGAQIVRNFAILNVTGKVLKRDTGRLASSITVAVTELPDGGVLRVGTQVKYGAYWERGFFRSAGLRRFKPRGERDYIFRWVKARQFAPRPWLRPAADQALPEVTRRIELQVNRALAKFGGTRTIEIKIV